MRKLFWLVPLILIANPVFAETLLLKSGKTVEGKIIEKNDKCVKVDISGLPVTYYLDQIESINGEKINNAAATGGPPAKAQGKETSQIGESFIHTSEIMGKEDEREYGMLVNNAVNLMNRKDFTAAVAEFEKAIQKNPQKTPAYLDISACYHLMNQNEKALEYLKKAYAINPNDIAIVGNLGAIYFHLGEYERGIEYLKKAIQMGQDYPANYYNLGIAYYELKKYKEAKENFVKAKELYKSENDAKGLAAADSYLSELQNIK